MVEVNLNIWEMVYIRRTRLFWIWQNKLSTLWAQKYSIARKRSILPASWSGCTLVARHPRRSCDRGPCKAARPSERRWCIVCRTSPSDVLSI